jgi:hypothetical protein
MEGKNVFKNKRYRCGPGGHRIARTESPSPTDGAPVIAPIVDSGLSEPQKERLIELEKVITDRLAIGWDFCRACLLSGLN